MAHSPRIEPSEERGMELEESLASCTSQEMKPDFQGTGRDLRGMGHAPPSTSPSIRGMPSKERLRGLKVPVEPRRDRPTSFPERA